MVLEVLPWSFSDRPSPKNGPSRDYPDDWLSYFKACMSDAGLHGIVPISPGSFFVRALDVASNALFVELLDREFADVLANDAEGDESLPIWERVGPLSGGYALIESGEVLVEPECCGDIANIAEWRSINLEEEAAGEVWIGHPALKYLVQHGTVKVRQGWEFPPIPPHLVEVTIEIPILKACVAQAESEHAMFREALWQLVIKRFGPEGPVQELCDAMVGVHSAAPNQH